MKKLLFFISAVSLGLIVYGCGSDGESNKTEQISSKIAKEDISEDEFKKLNLSYEEFADVAKKVAIANGEDEKNLDNILQENHDVFEKNYYNYINNSETATSDEGQLLKPTDTTQNVEYESKPLQQKWATNYSKVLLCDNDPSDEDWELYFYPAWTNTNPDKVRWESYNNWMYIVFKSAYGGNLLGNNLSSIPAKLCLGTNGVALAGGIGLVRDSLAIGKSKY